VSYAQLSNSNGLVKDLAGLQPGQQPESCELEGNWSQALMKLSKTWSNTRDFDCMSTVVTFGLNCTKSVQFRLGRWCRTNEVRVANVPLAISLHPLGVGGMAVETRKKCLIVILPVLLLPDMVQLTAPSATYIRMQLVCESNIAQIWVAVF
jgi:hypothetical protein